MRGGGTKGLGYDTIASLKGVVQMDQLDDRHAVILVQDAERSGPRDDRIAVIVRRWLQVLLVTAGAISFVEGIVPARRAAPPALPHGGRQRTTIDARNASAPGVEAPSADPDKSRRRGRSGPIRPRCRPSTRPEMTLDRWTSFLVVRVVPASGSLVPRIVLPYGVPTA